MIIYLTQLFFYSTIVFELIGLNDDYQISVVFLKMKQDTLAHMNGIPTRLILYCVSEIWD